MRTLINRITASRRWTVVLDWVDDAEKFIEEPLTIHVRAANPMAALDRAWESLADDITDPEEATYHVVTFRGFRTAQQVAPGTQN